MADQWNQDWNQTWNEAWNVGYNEAQQGMGSGVTPLGYLPNFNDQASLPGWSEGYLAGQQEYYSRNPSGDVLGATTSSAPTSTSSGGGGGSSQGEWLTGEQVRAMGINPDQYSSTEGKYYVVNGQVQAPGGGGGGPSPEQLALQRAKEGYQKQYEPIFNYLDQLAGNLPQWRQEREGTIDNLYQSQLGELETARGGSMSNLEAQRGNVQTQQARNVRELSSNLTNMLKAGNVYLGTMGASDSSASPMYAAAMGRAANQGRTDIMRQAQDRYSQIDQAAQQVQNTFQEQKAQLETWKANEVGKLVDWYQTKLQEVQSAKANASAEKQAALNATEQSIIQDSINYLRQLDAQAQQWNNAMQEWAINRMAQLDDAKIQLGQYGNFRPEDITRQELAGLSGLGQGQNAGDFFTNPFLLKRKAEEERLRSIF